MTDHQQKPVIFWTAVRGVFGIAQMTGAVASTALLFRLVTARETIIAVSITAILSLISVALFKWLKGQGKT